jgi:hypothetical protein
MKNEVTFDLEMRNLQTLFGDRKFEQAEQLVSRMLTDYNKLDY